MEVKGIKIKKVSIALFVLALACLVGLLPPVREVAIAVAEGKLGKTIDHAYWHKYMILMSLCAFAFFVVLAVAYNVFDFPKFTPPDLQASDFRRYGIKSEVKIFGNKRFALGFLLVFAVLFVTRVYWISQKKSYYWDEAHSIAIANRNPYGSINIKEYSKPFETNRLYTGRELKEGYHWSDGSLRDALSDLLHLWINDNGDTAHPNLYLALYRAWFVGAQTYNFKEIVWRGCILNLVIFAFSYWFMFALLSRFTQSKANILLCLFVSFCNPQTISSTVFMRDYELQTCLFILVALLFTDSFGALWDSSRFESKRNFVLGALMIALCLLAGYFSLIFAAFLGLVLLVLCFKKQRKGSADFLVWMFVLSIVFAKILHLNYGTSLFIGAGKGLFSAATVHNSIKTLLSVVLLGIYFFMRKNVFLTIFFVIFLALTAVGIVCFAKDKNKSGSAVCKLVLFCCAAVFYFAALYLTPYKLLRYAVPAFPFISLPFVFAYASGGKKGRLACGVCSAVACLCLFVSVLPPNGRVLIDYLDNARVDEIEMVKDASIPVVFFGESRFPMQIPYVQDEQKVFFINEMEDLDAIKAEYGKIWLCMADHDSELFPTIKYNIVRQNEITIATEFLLD